MTDVVADRAGKAMALFAAEHPAVAKRTLVIAGGVAANQAIRARLVTVASQQGFTLVAPPIRLCADNAVMIAWAGAERLALGLTDPLDAAGPAALASGRTGTARAWEWREGSQGMIETIGVLGGGAWGTALALTAARAGRKVRLWARDHATVTAIDETHENPRHLPGIKLDHIPATTEHCGGAPRRRNPPCGAGAGGPRRGGDRRALSRSSGTARRRGERASSGGRESA